jgi:hypothetical protein
MVRWLTAASIFHCLTVKSLANPAISMDTTLFISNKNAIPTGERLNGIQEVKSSILPISPP